jgi:hypothetical protein
MPGSGRWQFAEDVGSGTTDKHGQPRTSTKRVDKQGRDGSLSCPWFVERSYPFTAERYTFPVGAIRSKPGSRGQNRIFRFHRPATERGRARFSKTAERYLMQSKVGRVFPKPPKDISCRERRGWAAILLLDKPRKAQKAQNG